MFLEVRLLPGGGLASLLSFNPQDQLTSPGWATATTPQPPSVLAFSPLNLILMQLLYELVFLLSLSLSLQVLGEFLKGEAYLVCAFRHSCCKYWTTELATLRPSRNGKAHRKFRLRNRVDPTMFTVPPGSQRGN